MRDRPVDPAAHQHGMNRGGRRPPVAQRSAPGGGAAFRRRCTFHEDSTLNYPRTGRGRVGSSIRLGVFLSHESIGEAMRQRAVSLQAFAVVLGLAGIAALSLARTRRAFFWQDDFVFLTQARDSSLTIDYLASPLFTHFSPVARASHWFIANVAPGWASIRASMFLILLATALLMVIFAVRIGAAVPIAFAFASLWLFTSSQIRTTSWWSAFIQDVPQVPLLLAALIVWLAIHRRPSALLSTSLVVLLLLNGLAYEMGYLAPIFIVASSILLPEGLETVRRWRRDQVLLLALAASISIFFVWFNQTRYAPDLPPASVLAVGKSAVAFAGGGTTPALFGLAPFDTWSGVLLGLSLLTALALLSVWGVPGRRVSLLAALSVPFAAVAGTLAVARAGLESGQEVPHYPLDLQYQPLALAWIACWFAVVLSARCESSARNPDRRKAQVAIAVLAAVMAGALTGHLLQVSQDERVVLQSGQMGLARDYETALNSMSGSQYAVERSVPFVLPQFGAYSLLSSAAAVFSPSSRPKVLFGEQPVWVDELGAHPLADIGSRADTGERQAKACAILDGSNRVFSVPANAETGELVSGRISSSPEADLRLGVVLRSDGTDTFGPIGEVRSGLTSFAYQVPLVPNAMRGADRATLVRLDIEALGSASTEACLGDLTVNPQAPG